MLHLIFCVLDTTISILKVKNLRLKEVNFKISQDISGRPEGVVNHGLGETGAGEMRPGKFQGHPTSTKIQAFPLKQVLREQQAQTSEYWLGCLSRVF